MLKTSKLLIFLFNLASILALSHDQEIEEYILKDYKNANFPSNSSINITFSAHFFGVT